MSRLEAFVSLVTLVGALLLYIFPAVQAVQELRSYADLLKKYRYFEYNEQKTNKFWIIVYPYRIKLEKERARKILKKFIKNKSEFDMLFQFLDRATAWWYVALAGALNSISATYSLIKTLNLQISLLFFLGIVSMILILGYLQIRYRVSAARLKKKRKNFFR